MEADIKVSAISNGMVKKYCRKKIKEIINNYHNVVGKVHFYHLKKLPEMTPKNLEDFVNKA